MQNFADRPSSVNRNADVASSFACRQVTEVGLSGTVRSGRDVQAHIWTRLGGWGRSRSQALRHFHSSHSGRNPEAGRSEFLCPCLESCRIIYWNYEEHILAQRSLLVILWYSSVSCSLLQLCVHRRKSSWLSGGLCLKRRLLRNWRRQRNTPRPRTSAVCFQCHAFSRMQGAADPPKC